MTISLRPSTTGLTLRTPTAPAPAPAPAVNVGPTNIVNPIRRPIASTMTSAAPSPVAADTASSPAMMSSTAARTPVLMTTPQRTTTPALTIAPPAQAAPVAPMTTPQERPTMAATAPLFQFPATTTQASPAQVAATPKPLPIATTLPILQTPVFQQPVTTNQPTVQTAQTTSAQVQVPVTAPVRTTTTGPSPGTQVPTSFQLPGRTSPQAQPPQPTVEATPPPGFALTSLRAALVKWLTDFSLFATDSIVIGKSQTQNPLAALTSASQPATIIEGGTKMTVVPDDVFAGYLGAFAQARQVLGLPATVPDPNTRRVADAIPAIQALISLVDLRIAGQPLPDKLPAALTGSGPFYTRWWFWTVLGLGAVGTAAYILHKRAG